MNLQQANSTRITLHDQQYRPVDGSIAATNAIENPQQTQQSATLTAAVTT